MTEQKTKLRFSPEQKSPTLDLQIGGEYHRTFNADEQPFEVAGAEEFEMLLRTKHFVKDEPVAAEVKANGEEVKEESSTRAAADLVEADAGGTPAVPANRSKASKGTRSQPPPTE